MTINKPCPDELIISESNFLDSSQPECSFADQVATVALNSLHVEDRHTTLEIPLQVTQESFHLFDLELNAFEEAIMHKHQGVRKLHDNVVDAACTESMFPDEVEDLVERRMDHYRRESRDLSFILRNDNKIHKISHHLNFIEENASLYGHQFVKDQLALVDRIVSTVLSFRKRREKEGIDYINSWLHLKNWSHQLYDLLIPIEKRTGSRVRFSDDAPSVCVFNSSASYLWDYSDDSDDSDEEDRITASRPLFNDKVLNRKNSFLGQALTFEFYLQNRLELDCKTSEKVKLFMEVRRLFNRILDFAISHDLSIHNAAQVARTREEIYECYMVLRATCSDSMRKYDQEIEQHVKEFLNRPEMEAWLLTLN